MTLMIDGPYGGIGGIPFSDDEVVCPTILGQVSGIRIWHDKFIDRIEVDYVDRFCHVFTFCHGKAGGTLGHFDLGDDERIIGIRGRSGAYVDQLTFITNRRGEIGPFGGSGGTPFEFGVPETGSFVAFFGRSGHFIDQIGFFYAPELSSF